MWHKFAKDAGCQDNGIENHKNTDDILWRKARQETEKNEKNGFQGHYYCFQIL